MKTTAERKADLASEIEGMNKHELGKLKNPTPDIERLIDARRAVIRDDRTRYEKIKAKQALNDTTATTGKHPELRAPSVHKPPPLLRERLMSKKDKGASARAQRELIVGMQDEIRNEIYKKAELMRTEFDEPDNKEIKRVAKWIRTKQLELKKAQAEWALKFGPEPTVEAVKERLRGVGDSPPLSPTGAVVGSRPGTPPPIPSTPPTLPSTPPRGKTSKVLIQQSTPVEEKYESREPSMEPVRLDFDAPSRDEDEKRWSGSDSSDRFPDVSDAGNVSEGSQHEIVQGDWDDDVGAIAARVVQQNEVIDKLPWYVPLPTNPLMKFKPDVAPINDEGNAPFFHREFLDRGGPRNKVGIPFGYMLLRPKSVEINTTRNTFATRQEVANFLLGRFPMGGVINKKSYSNAELPLAVFRSIPGKVTVTY